MSCRALTATWNRKIKVLTAFVILLDWLIDWLVGLHWVQALKVPIHLGLKDWPFVLHNLISAQDSPVPLPKSQMAPRLKILISCRPKKVTQIYYPFSWKSPGKRIPSRFPKRGPYGERCPLTGHFYISFDIYIFYLSVRFSSKGASSISLIRVPMDRNAPSPEPLVHSFIHVSRSPQKEPTYAWGKT